MLREEARGRGAVRPGRLRRPRREARFRSEIASQAAAIERSRDLALREQAPRARARLEGRSAVEVMCPSPQTRPQVVSSRCAILCGSPRHGRARTATC